MHYPDASFCRFEKIKEPKHGVATFCTHIGAAKTFADCKSLTLAKGGNALNWYSTEPNCYIKKCNSTDMYIRPHKMAAQVYLVRCYEGKDLVLSFLKEH